MKLSGHPLTAIPKAQPHKAEKSKTGSEKDSTRQNRKLVTNPLCHVKKKKKSRTRANEL